MKNVNQWVILQLHVAEGLCIRTGKICKSDKNQMKLDHVAR